VNKKIFLFFMLLFPVLIFCKPDKFDKKRGLISRVWSKINNVTSKLPIISKIGKTKRKKGDKGIVSTNLQSYKPYDLDEYEIQGRANYTRLSKELFKAYFNRESCDDTEEIEDILGRCERSKLYHLNRAFIYGARKLRKNLNPNKRTKIERTIWSISQDFAYENVSPKLTRKIVKYSSMGIVFVVGCYFGEHFNTWGDITGLIRRFFRICG